MNKNYDEKAEEIARRLERRHGYVNDHYPGFFDNMKDEIVELVASVRAEEREEVLQAVENLVHHTIACSVYKAPNRCNCQRSEFYHKDIIEVIKNA